MESDSLKSDVVNTVNSEVQPINIEKDPKPVTTDSSLTQVPIVSNVHVLAETPVAIDTAGALKEVPKTSPKKPKKRKPKAARDTTAPRQPLTGLALILDVLFLLNSLLKSFIYNFKTNEYSYLRLCKIFK